jgi:hypothetical protein
MTLTARQRCRQEPSLLRFREFGHGPQIALRHPKAYFDVSTLRVCAYGADLLRLESSRFQCEGCGQPSRAFQRKSISRLVQTMNIQDGTEHQTSVCRSPELCIPAHHSLSHGSVARSGCTLLRSLYSSTFLDFDKRKPRMTYAETCKFGR